MDEEGEKVKIQGGFGWLVFLLKGWGRTVHLVWSKELITKDFERVMFGLSVRQTRLKIIGDVDMVHREDLG